ncbi:MAG TPA: hypothetical protein VMV46_09740 [Thermoanaerobaculia bacterium]|nr:hypothetical protein [Thermoanaerobaculia bacterium]
MTPPRTHTTTALSTTRRTATGPRSLLRCLALRRGLFLAMLLAPAALPADDDAAQKATLQDLRNLGTGLMSWLTDEAAKAPREEPAPGPSRETEAEPDPQAPIDLTSIPVVTRSELEALLVPEYLPEIPELDGWGGAFEVRMHPDLPTLAGRPLLTIRSAGADGVFDADTYAPGPYPPASATRDLVWVDGYFVSWPQG